VSELPELERKIMKLRYGLNGDVTPRSVRELTDKLGIPTRQIRRLEANGLARLGRMRGLQGLRE
jgi:DNA-directed RNA polymerase sigma subunit (sigma70/sigma32)